MDMICGWGVRVMALQETRVSGAAAPSTLQALRRHGWSGVLAPARTGAHGQLGLGLLAAEPAQLVDSKAQVAGAGQ
eukprot:10491032-Alexandrium_andersonii.AAC.1